MRNLIDTIFEIVKDYPGQVGRVYTRILRTNGFPNISKHEVNSILYSRRDLFTASIGDNYIPSWSVVENAKIIPPSVQIQTHKVEQVSTHFVNKPRLEKAIQESNRFVWNDRFSLYRWQERALNSWQENGYQGIVEAVTGSGKTRLALAAMDAHLEIGYKVLVIVPYKELMNQWSDNIRKAFPTYKIGYLGDGNRQSLKFIDILIGISNSVQKYRTLPPNTKALIIADEVHHYGTTASEKMLEKGFSRRIGLTASLERNDDGVERVIKSYFGDFSYPYGYSEAIDDNVIAPFRILFVSVKMDTFEQEEYSRISSRINKLKLSLERKYPEIMKSSDGTFSQKINRLPYQDKEVQLYKASTFKRSQMVVNMHSKLSIVKHMASIIKKSNGAFVFTQLTEINRKISQELSARSVKIIPMDGGYKPEERRSILRSFMDRKIEAIAAPKLLDEGIDVPHADLAIITGKSNSKRQLIQRLGRVVRRKVDNGIGRIIILVSKDTTEDPDVYDNDAFYDAFKGADIKINRIEVENDFEELEEYLEEWST